jgi:hypothetical protein
VVSSGPNGHPFQFSFANRNSSQMLNDLSQALVIIAESVPDGVRQRRLVGTLVNFDSSCRLLFFFSHMHMKRKCECFCRFLCDLVAQRNRGFLQLRAFGKKSLLAANLQI